MAKSAAKKNQSKPKAKPKAKPTAKSSKKVTSSKAKLTAQSKVKSTAKSTAKSKSQTKAKKATAKVAAKLKTSAKVTGKAKSKAASKVKIKAPVGLTTKPQSKVKASSDAYARMFTPLDDRVLVLKSGASDRTPGGLFIPEMVAREDRPFEGKVVAVGQGHRDKKGRLRPLDVKIGDTVMFNSYTGSEVKIGDESLLCLRENEIIAVVK